MAIPVIGGAFLRIAQNAISLGGFLEPLLGVLIVRIPVRVVLECQFPISALQPRVVTVAAHAQNFVVVALCRVHLLVTAFISSLPPLSPWRAAVGVRGSCIRADTRREWSAHPHRRFPPCRRHGEDGDRISVPSR